jgi:acyl dehydratase
MALDLEKLLALKIPDTAQSYTFKDSLLYAVSLGYGSDPLDTQELPYVFEGADGGQRVAPSMGVILAHPGYWPRTLDTGLDWVRIVHAEQGLALHRPLPAQAEVVGISRVVSAIDKGKDKGALITYERKILERASGEPLCTITQVMMARGDGGFGGPAASAPLPPGIPDRAPDRVCELSTAPQMALLYRLNADWNPLHADPAVARKAGFERPILHGLASWGVAVRAVLSSALEYDADRMASIFGRFSAPVYPGETLRTDLWLEPDAVAFRVWAVERNVMVINNGRVGLRKRI